MATTLTSFTAKFHLFHPSEWLQLEGQCSVDCFLRVEDVNLLVRRRDPQQTEQNNKRCFLHDGGLLLPLDCVYFLCLQVVAGGLELRPCVSVCFTCRGYKTPRFAQSKKLARRQNASRLYKLNGYHRVSLKSGLTEQNFIMFLNVLQLVFFITRGGCFSPAASLPGVVTVGVAFPATGLALLWLLLLFSTSGQNLFLLSRFCSTWLSPIVTTFLLLEPPTSRKSSSSEYSPESSTSMLAGGSFSSGQPWQLLLGVKEKLFA